MKLRTISAIVVLLAIIIGGSGSLMLLGKGSASPYKSPDPKDPPLAITQDYG